MLNNCQFIGNLGRDPETRALPNGDKVTTITIACTEKWKSKDGESKEKTEWIRCVLWGGLAGIAEKYLRKGSKIYLDGRMETRKYEKDGRDVYATEINVKTLKMLDTRRADDAPQNDTATDTSATAEEIPF